MPYTFLWVTNSHKLIDAPYQIGGSSEGITSVHGEFGTIQCAFESGVRCDWTSVRPIRLLNCRTHPCGTAAMERFYRWLLSLLTMPWDLMDLPAVMFYGKMSRNCMPTDDQHPTNLMQAKAVRRSTEGLAMFLVRRKLKYVLQTGRTSDVWDNKPVEHLLLLLAVQLHFMGKWMNLLYLRYCWM